MKAEEYQEQALTEMKKQTHLLEFLVYVENERSKLTFPTQDQARDVERRYLMCMRKIGKPYKLPRWAKETDFTTE
jgi:hypothetical protein